MADGERCRPRDPHSSRLSTVTPVLLIRVGVIIDPWPKPQHARNEDQGAERNNYPQDDSPPVKELHLAEGRNWVSNRSFSPGSQSIQLGVIFLFFSTGSRRRLHCPFDFPTFQPTASHHHTVTRPSSSNRYTRTSFKVDSMAQHHEHPACRFGCCTACHAFGMPKQRKGAASQRGQRPSQWLDPNRYEPHHCCRSARRPAPN